MIDKLKPCPFCGGKMEDPIGSMIFHANIEVGSRKKDNCYVRCPDCYACGPTVRVAAGLARDLTIAAWDKRVTEASND